MTLHDFTDIHTHRQDAPSDALISLAPGLPHAPGRFYSVGIHPWDTANLAADEIAALMQQLESEARRPEVVAIGEAGIDTLRGAPLELQREVFAAQARLAEEVGKPLIIHAVRSFDDIMALRRRLAPKQQWVIHGFRGKPAMARRLLDCGIDLSFGEHFNPDSAALVPANRLFVETDTSELPIGEIARRIHQARDTANTP